MVGGITKTGKAKELIIPKKSTKINLVDKVMEKYKIGSFGSTIVFAVNKNKVLTFNGLNRTVSGRWETHPSINKKEKSEFVGPGLSNMTMTVELNSALGVKPREMIDKIEKAAEKGTAEYLIVGGKKICSNKVYIKEISESWDEVMLNGVLVKATLNLTFDEYGS